MNNFIKEVTFSPAWDKTNPTINRHCVEIIFLLKGEKGAIQFLLLSGWFLPESEQAFNHMIINGQFNPFKPFPADLGYHSYIPMYKKHFPEENCAFLDGCRCYYHGSSLMAQRVYDRLLREGDKGVWDELEKSYQDTFADVDISQVEEAKLKHAR